jgi:adenylosuccinate synthase
MKLKQKVAYTVTDLGPGDGGKGGTLHAICKRAKPHTVVKIGGAQGSHGVQDDDGIQFAFGQFGCGTLGGARTHISDRFVMYPNGLLNEAEALQYEAGVHDALRLLTVDETTLCATPFHGIASRLRELARGNNPRGSVGTGVGEAYRDAVLHPNLAFHAGDLVGTETRRKLERIRDHVIAELADVLTMEFLPADQAEARREIELLQDSGYLEYVADLYRQVGQQVTLVDPDYERRVILRRDGVTVYESSHGGLTDYYHGFAPHTSKLRTLPQHLVWDRLDEWGYDGKVVKLAVSRAYQIRHGAGPMPTDDPALRDRILPGAVVDDYDRYRGEVRVGALDFVAMRYSLAGCGGAEQFDGVSIMCFDQVVADGQWRVCDRYEHADDPRFFALGGKIIARDDATDDRLLHQTALAERLRACTPVVTTYQIDPTATRKDQVELCKRVIADALGLEVKLVSFGPQYKDKEFL